RVVRVGVVAERVDDRALPSIRAVRISEGAHEACRIVVRGRRADDVHLRAQPVQARPARREELLVALCARRGGPELRRIGLVPDRDVAERNAHEDVVEEVAVLPPLEVVDGSVLGLSEDRDDHTLAALDEQGGAVEIDADVRRTALASPPGNRERDGVETELPVLGDEPVGTGEPLRMVVVDPDHERARRGARWPRIGGSRERWRHQSADPEETEDASRHRRAHILMALGRGSTGRMSSPQASGRFFAVPARRGNPPGVGSTFRTTTRPPPSPSSRPPSCSATRATRALSASRPSQRTAAPPGLTSGRHNSVATGGLASALASATPYASTC